MLWPNQCFGAGDDIINYCSHTDNILSNIRLHADTFVCTDLKCKNENHTNDIEGLYQDLTKSLIDRREN